MRKYALGLGRPAEKGNPVGKATENMIRYASKIADFLGVPKPNFDDFDSTFSFIGNHKPAYNAQVNLELSEAHKRHRVEFENKKMLESHPGLIFSASYSDFLISMEGKQGIYILFAGESIEYIGKSKNLGSRIFGSVNERRIQNLAINSVAVIETKTLVDMNALELVLIAENRPKLNTESNNGDSLTIFASGIDIKKLERISLYSPQISKAADPAAQMTRQEQ